MYLNPKKKTNEEVSEKMIKLIEKDLKLPHLVNEIDKLHRVRNVKEMNESQDIIIKFKSHAAR